MESFLGEMRALGIPVGDYNRPVFSDSPEDLQRLLTSLFSTTPPTAIVAGNLDMYQAAQQFPARRKLLVPEDVSVISGDPDPSFGPVPEGRWAIGGSDKLRTPRIINTIRR
jgi:DNA-binding LacI/PurR family transcriptional regulator